MSEKGGGQGREYPGREAKKDWAREARGKQHLPQLSLPVAQRGHPGQLHATQHGEKPVTNAINVSLPPMIQELWTHTCRQLPCHGCHFTPCDPNRHKCYKLARRGCPGQFYRNT